MTSLHPAILICWLILAASVVLVVGAICADWWERRQDTKTRQLLIGPSRLARRTTWNGSTRTVDFIRSAPLHVGTCETCGAADVELSWSHECRPCWDAAEALL